MELYIEDDTIGSVILGSHFAPIWARFEKMSYHNLAKANGYGFSSTEVAYLTYRYIKGTKRERRWIESLFEDINYHYENSLLINGEYSKIADEWNFPTTTRDLILQQISASK